jgi:hypothetical protein
MNMKRNPSIGKRGIALIWVYMVAAFFSTMLVSLYGLNVTKMRLGMHDADKIQAFYLAETGMDMKMVELRTGNFDAIPETDFNGVGTYEVSYNQATGLLTSTGRTSTGLESTVSARTYLTPITPTPVIMGAVTFGNKGIVRNTLEVDGNERAWSGTGDEYDSRCFVDGVPLSLCATKPGVMYNIRNFCAPGMGGGPVCFQLGKDSGALDPLIGGNKNAPAFPYAAGAVQSSVFEVPVEKPEQSFWPENDGLRNFQTQTIPISLSNEIKWYVIQPCENESDPPVRITMGTHDDPWTGILIIYNDQALSEPVELAGVINGLVVAGEKLILVDEAVILGALILVDDEESTLEGPVSQTLGSYGRVYYNKTVIDNLPLPPVEDYSVSVIDWAEVKGSTNPLE